MKKFITYSYLRLFILIILLFPAACTNLDEKVYDQISIDQYGKTVGELNSLVAPIYTSMAAWAGLNNPSGPLGINEDYSDMAITPTRKGGDWWDGGIYKEARLGTWTPTSSNVEGWYNTCFATITTCNQVLLMIESSTVISDEDKLAYTSQIRAARALWYYQLVDYYGNVPIVSDFTDLSKPSTKTRKEVYLFIMSELNAIKDIIRSDVSTSSYGKFTKGAVYSMLAKMYLNAMVWNPTDGPKWQECIDACNVVLALPYSLEPVWKDNFVTNNEGCKETILAIVNNDVRGNAIVGFGLHTLDYIALGIQTGGWHGICAMPDYVKAYDPDDKRLAGSFLIGPMIDPATGEVIITTNGRPLIHTIDVTMKYNIDADGWGQTEQEDGARCFKWEYKKGLNGYLENDCAIFRLADIYLMKAEALVRKGENNAEATRLVNEIRGRVFTDPSKLKASVTLDDIYKERRFEFAWESMTRQDQIRFGTFLDPIPGWRGALPAKCLLLPIPQPALDANPNLQQNPGY